MPVRPDFIPFLKEMRALSEDADGNLVLVGLTLEETDEYFDLLDTDKTRRVSLSERDQRSERYLQLHDIHEQVRREILIAENQQRIDRPTNH